MAIFGMPWGIYFNPRAPYGARPNRHFILSPFKKHFNPRAPYGARQQNRTINGVEKTISILAPLTGRDYNVPVGFRLTAHFNPRAPYGARRQKYTKIACVFAITDKGQRLSPRQAPSVRTPDQEARGNRDKTRCEPSQKYRMLALRTTGSSAPQEDMFVCSQSVRSYSHTFSRDNKTEGCPFLRP